MRLTSKREQELSRTGKMAGIPVGEAFEGRNY